MSTASDALHSITSITNNRGVTFDDFRRMATEEKEAILKYTFMPQPEDPTLKDKDNARAVAYLARVGYNHSKARAYALKARGVAVWALLSEGEKVSVVSDLAKRYTAQFEEEVGDWEAISDALHERLWTGRGEMRRLNRGEG